MSPPWNSGVRFRANTLLRTPLSGPPNCSFHNPSGRAYMSVQYMIYTVCPRSISYPFYIVTYYIKWVSWTYIMRERYTCIIYNIITLDLRTRRITFVARWWIFLGDSRRLICCPPPAVGNYPGSRFGGLTGEDLFFSYIDIGGC